MIWFNYCFLFGFVALLEVLRILSFDLSAFSCNKILFLSPHDLSITHRENNYPPLILSDYFPIVNSTDLSTCLFSGMICKDQNHKHCNAIPKGLSYFVRRLRFDRLETLLFYRISSLLDDLDHV